ncbi:MAG: class I SAM-dependent methyltransferase [Sphingomonadales bacterium]|nr:class I SAM-dependent methyltransferase [Sphingomonadales bacterium]
MKIKSDAIFNITLKEKTISFGHQVSYEWKHDAKYLCFSLSLYKFVAKMFEGLDSVLEIGAGDGFKSRIVFQSVKNLTRSDYKDINKNYYITEDKKKQKYLVHNFIEKKLNRKYCGIYALDVIEYISKKNEDKFITNILYSLKTKGILIFETPSIESPKYASRLSKLGHINFKNKTEFKKITLNYFHFVFSFSMNDEVLHTGLDKMSYYIFVVCCAKK